MVCPLLRRCGTGGDDTNRVFAEGVDDHQKSPVCGHADRRFAFLTSYRLGVQELEERIEEDLAGCLEGDAVLAKIGIRLPTVPY